MSLLHYDLAVYVKGCHYWTIIFSHNIQHRNWVKVQEGRTYYQSSKKGRGGEDSYFCIIYQHLYLFLWALKNLALLSLAFQSGSQRSDITLSTCRNLEYRSLPATWQPLLPHRNFMWNSVLNMSNIKSSYLTFSKTISLFRLYTGHCWVIALPISKCVKRSWRP